MSTNHTPGPWTFDQEDDNSTDFWIFQANGPARIAVEVSERDAALIAAAPDLLAALQYALERFECIPEHRDEIGLYRHGARLARAAIAKATGA